MSKAINTTTSDLLPTGSAPVIRTASLAYLQSPAKIEGVGGGITTLNVCEAGAKNCQKLVVTDQGLVVTASGIESLIPWANVKVCKLKA